MIPEFDENSNLPLGIHGATWEEFVERFGITERRLLMIKGLKLAMESLKGAGCRTIYIDGSFITSKLKPQDFDACWEPGDNVPRFLTLPKLHLLSTHLSLVIDYFRLYYY